MKNILKFGFLSLLAIIAFSSCEDDGTTGGNTNPGGGGGTDPSDPAVQLVAETGFVSSDATILPGSVFSVKLQADKGDDPLKALTITENGVDLDINRISFDGAAAFANPTLVTGNAVDGFETQIDIVAHDGESTSTYTFEILDEADKVVTTSVVITTMNEVVITPPIILIEGIGMQVTAGTKVTIPVTVSNVTDSLYSLAILENGNYIDPLRLWYDDESVQFPSNPLGFPDADVFGFTRDMIILTSTTPGLRTFTIEIEDVEGEVYTKDFTLETVSAGSPVTTLEGVLFNRAGPVGTGGLDLDTGNGTGSSDVEAEIKDEGIDNGPLASNWIRRISGVNGSSVKHLFKGQNGLPDNYDFNNITTSEQVSALFDSGTTFVDSNTSGELISLRVEVGDEFIVRRDSRNYLIKVTQINETVDDNGDNYVLDIKF